MVKTFSEAQKQNLIPAGEPFHLIYVLLGSLTTFSRSAHRQWLAGCEIRNPKEIEFFADLIISLLTPKCASRPPPFEALRLFSGRSDTLDTTFILLILRHFERYWWATM